MRISLGLRPMVKIFENGNTCVTGLRGKGKDLLQGNVIVRRNLPYVSNVEYGGVCLPFDYDSIDVGGNIYTNFIKGDIKHYEYPYEDGTDVYLSDAGVYFPAQYCSELNRHYGQMAVFQALSRHLGLCNFHVNTQALNRVWDKIREQCDQYILCTWCKYFHGLVFQLVRVYDTYEAAVHKVKPFRVRLPLFANREMRLHHNMEKDRYEQQYGVVKTYFLVYRNKSSYDTRRFKAILREGKR